MMLKNKQMRPLEVKRLLRSLGQPIQLFGETGEERLERYHAISAALPTENEDDRVLKNLEHGIADRQLFDESGKSKLESGAAKAGGGNDDKDEFGEEELAATFVPATPEQNVSRFGRKRWVRDQRPRTCQRREFQRSKSATINSVAGI
jgi:hypothetical protein